VARAVAVLGMNRSGTSSLAGLLRDSGFHLGNVRERSSHNPKGNLENPAIWQLHDDVLAKNFGSWDKPPSSDLRWDEEHKLRLKKIIEKFQGHELWAVKDPRMVFTLDAWLGFVPHLELMGTFRHPVAVALSLQKRNGLSIPVGIDLWHNYNKKLIEIWDRRPFGIVNFDLASEAYLDQFLLALFDLGHTVDRTQLTFFKPGLRTCSAPQDIEATREARLLYDRLLEIQAGGLSQTEIRRAGDRTAK